VSGDDPLSERPFSFVETKDGRLQIFCRGKLASTLKGREAARLLSRLDGSDESKAQLVMAKATGQFKFGNERLGKNRRNE
jgi:hypothetical protein